MIFLTATSISELFFSLPHNPPTFRWVTICQLLTNTHHVLRPLWVPQGTPGGRGLVPIPGAGCELHPSTSALTHAYLVQSCQFYKMGCAVFTHNDEQI